MEPSNYLLSICIPTYNRCKYLKKSLDSIVCQEPFLNETVEVVVSDNASTDDTEQVVKEYINRYSNVRYFKNQENVRDRNFPIVLGEASGVLRKLSNDTALYQKGALNKLCEIAAKWMDANDKPVIFVANREVNSETGLFELQEAVRRISYWNTSTCCFCIWGEDCANISAETKGCDLHLWQVGKFYDMAIARGRVYLVAERLFEVQTVTQKDISYGVYSVFYVNYLGIVHEYVNKGAIGEEVFDFLERDVFFHFLIYSTIMWELKAKGLQYSPDEDLKALVFNACKPKPYFKEFVHCYRKRKLIERIKRPLRFIKHKILHL